MGTAPTSGTHSSRGKKGSYENPKDVWTANLPQIRKKVKKKNKGVQRALWWDRVQSWRKGGQKPFEPDEEEEVS